LEQNSTLEKGYSEIHQSKKQSPQYLPPIKNGKAYKEAGKDNLYLQEKSIT
jgi:hypothetical protein